MLGAFAKESALESGIHGLLYKIKKRASRSSGGPFFIKHGSRIFAREIIKALCDYVYCCRFAQSSALAMPPKRLISKDKTGYFIFSFS